MNIVARVARFAISKDGRMHVLGADEKPLCGLPTAAPFTAVFQGDSEEFHRDRSRCPECLVHSGRTRPA